MEAGMSRKRKAANHQDGELLSKKLKRLNLERDGQTLHIPLPPAPSSPPPKPLPQSFPPLFEDDSMQLDNTKYKVYIHSIDDELSDSESSDDGKVTFLPDIERRIRNMQIPKSILSPPKNNEDETRNQQLVLYNVPSSLTLPEEKDSVRKAIIETRARVRDQVRKDSMREDQALAQAQGQGQVASGSAMLLPNAGTGTMAIPSPFLTNMSVELGSVGEPMMIDDPDAMDLS